MKKVKVISILMVVIMLFAIIMPTTKVLATDSEYSVYGFAGDYAYFETYVSDNGVRVYQTFVKVGTTIEGKLYNLNTETGKCELLGDLPDGTEIVESYGYGDITGEKPIISEDKKYVTFEVAGEYNVRLGYLDTLTSCIVVVLTEEEWNAKYNPTLSDSTTEELTTKLIDNANVIVTYSEASTIDREVFETLASTENATLNINYGNITWKFDSDTITKTDSMFTPAVQVSAEKFEYIKLDDIEDGLYVEFAYDGQLPGKADITIFIGTDKFGEGQKDLNLYYYNEISSEYEEMGIAKYNNGNVTLSLDHCSTYVLTEEKLGATETPEVVTEENEETNTTTNTDTTTNAETENETENKNENVNENEKDETPKTGVNNIYVIVASLLIVISAGTIVFVKKMK